MIELEHKAKSKIIYNKKIYNFFSQHRSPSIDNDGQNFARSYHILHNDLFAVDENENMYNNNLNLSYDLEYLILLHFFGCRKMHSHYFAREYRGQNNLLSVKK